MSSLKVDGEKIHNNEEILTEEVNLYRKLYTTENVDSSSITTYLSNINDITKLNVNNANLCGGTLSNALHIVDEFGLYSGLKFIKK